MIGAAVKDASDGDLAYDDALYYYNPSKVDLSKTTLAGEIIYQDASDGDTYLDDAVRFIAADLADGDSSLDDVFAGATKGGSKLPLKMNLQFFAKNGGSDPISLSKKAILKKNQLPIKGKIRFVPDKEWTPSQPLKKQNGGYIDRFGNLWTKGPSRTAGEAFEWDVQLSKKGIEQVGWLSRDNAHINVSLEGEITHR